MSRHRHNYTPVFKSDFRLINNLTMESVLMNGHLFKSDNLVDRCTMQLKLKNQKSQKTILIELWWSLVALVERTSLVLGTYFRKITPDFDFSWYWCSLYYRTLWTCTWGSYKGIVAIYSAII